MRTALVTGANRGIGLEICRQLAGNGLRVVLTARDAQLGRAAANELKQEGTDVRFQHLDLAEPKSIENCADALSSDGVEIDVLVNNGAVMVGGRILTSDLAELEQTMVINAYGTVVTCKAFVPHMIRRKYGRVVNVSSGSGSFDEKLHGPPAYSISKATLNAITMKLAEEVPDFVKINALCPGWVHTRMGGNSAPLSPEQGAETVVWLATLPDDGPSGGFFRERTPIPW